MRGNARDADVVGRLRDHGIGPSPLSSCALTTSANGLIMSYTNVAAEDARAATERMAAAMK